jgi:hypothetical protein
MSIANVPLSLLKYSLVLLNLIALGCASAPNLLFVGSDEILEYPLVRKINAAQDYPIVVTTTEGQKSVQIRWTTRGGWIWGETPFAKAQVVQFKLFQPGMEEALCDSGQIISSGERFDCPFTVTKYTSKPLVGELNYWFMDKPGVDDLPSVVLRTYYLIERPN